MPRVSLSCRQNHASTTPKLENAEEAASSPKIPEQKSESTMSDAPSSVKLAPWGRGKRTPLLLNPNTLTDTNGVHLFAKEFIAVNGPTTRGKIEESWNNMKKKHRKPYVTLARSNKNKKKKAKHRVKEEAV
ncbi:hypothetical protein V5O48_013981 [Marasmius crinis-equi]|uniref:Uncharacterized protein n=1 Tax=Marasmius crinis-equi TaxID=585013 RepID=A0ABR3EYL4_9AGAR